MLRSWSAGSEAHPQSEESALGFWRKSTASEARRKRKHTWLRRLDGPTQWLSGCGLASGTRLPYDMYMRGVRKGISVHAAVVVRWFGVHPQSEESVLGVFFLDKHYSPGSFIPPLFFGPFRTNAGDVCLTSISRSNRQTRLTKAMLALLCLRSSLRKEKAVVVARDGTHRAQTCQIYHKIGVGFCFYLYIPTLYSYLSRKPPKPIS